MKFIILTVIILSLIGIVSMSGCTHQNEYYKKIDFDKCYRELCPGGVVHYEYYNYNETVSILDGYTLINCRDEVFPARLACEYRCDSNDNTCAEYYEIT